MPKCKLGVLWTVLIVTDNLTILVVVAHHPVTRHPLEKGEGGFLISLIYPKDGLGPL